MTDPDAARDRVRDRVATLPDAVRDCERCGTAGAMAIRRSSLNQQFLADDVLLKCMECWYAATHGIPFDDPDAFDQELEELRGGGRVLDFAVDGDEPTPRENLEALGYIAASKEH